MTCCVDSILVLSINGRVFESKNDGLNFSDVMELSGKEIVFLSGKNKHCIAVSKECNVFVRGSNEYGQLDLGKEILLASSFMKISMLKQYKKSAAYAGGFINTSRLKKEKYFCVDGALMVSCLLIMKQVMLLIHQQKLHLKLEQLFVLLDTIEVQFLSDTVHQQTHQI